MARHSSILSATVLCCALTACLHPVSNTYEGLRLGNWRMQLDLNGHALPILFELRTDSTGLVMHIRNGEEDITVRDIALAKDSITVHVPPYDPVLTGVVRNDSTIEGEWTYMVRGEARHVPFVARAGELPRFFGPGSNSPDVAGEWEVHFSPRDSTNTYPATGIFEQKDGRVTGTFATETGDYRHLEGIVRNDSLLLSGFDGSHAYLFEAVASGDDLLGNFYSGVHHQEPWSGTRNATWHLRDPDSLTILAEGYTSVDLRFTDIDGDSITTTDAARKGKVLLVQVMGSWCPNCMDESALFNEFHGRYHARGLEVVALAFEKTDDKAVSVRSLERFRERLHIRYPIVLAGRASAQEVRTKLPFLKDLMSYPTAIIVDRSGRVRRVHTGFYGPGTGAHYVRFKRELEGFLESLLEEKGAIGGNIQ